MRPRASAACGANDGAGGASGGGGGGGGGAGGGRGREAYGMPPGGGVAPAGAGNHRFAARAGDAPTAGRRGAWEEAIEATVSVRPRGHAAGASNPDDSTL